VEDKIIELDQQSKYLQELKAIFMKENIFPEKF
jgi:hypothetical protein